MEFDLRFLDKTSKKFLQNAIDGVNKACVLHDCGGWNYVSAGKLIEAHKDFGAKPLDDVATCIFTEMEMMGHSGHTASWTISALTKLAKNFPRWRKDVILTRLQDIKEDLMVFIERMYEGKFASDGEEKPQDVSVRVNAVLHSIEYSFLVTNVLLQEDRDLLTYLLKIENVSHLGNEVLLEQIDTQLKLF
jgi:hypothetical protein